MASAVRSSEKVIGILGNRKVISEKLTLNLIPKE